MKLYVIRHGQSYVNLRDWNGGNVDAGLTDLGKKQADALAKWLPSEVKKVDHLYCSTMMRARETAAPVQLTYDIKPVYDDRIREIGNNRMDSQPWPSDNLPEYGDFWGTERPFHSITPKREGGESLMHFRLRIGSFVEDLLEAHFGETVMIVCHGGVIEAFYDHLFNIGHRKACEMWSKNTAVAHFEYIKYPNRETWRVYYHNRAEHLEGLKVK